jgi:methyl-accepting chemotaxis protein
MKYFRRRQLLVDSFQTRLLAVTLAYLGVALIGFAAALFIPLVLQLESNSTSWDQKMLASSQFLALHARLWPAMAVLIVLVAVHVVIVSHRVAGPLYQFRKVFRAVAQGDLGRRVAIRKNDYLTKEMKDINDMIASLDKNIAESRGATERAMAILQELRRASEGELAETHRLTGHLEVHLEQAMKSLDFYAPSHEEDGARALDALATGETSASMPT